MRFVLLNPNWTFGGSTYFGCREPHLPLEFGYAAALIERAGGEAHIIDAHLFGQDEKEIRKRVDALAPDVIVVTTAPSYLFWRCPQPELRVPLEILSHLKGIPALRLACGPHGTVTPEAVLRKLPVDGVLLGEFEEVLPLLLTRPLESIPALRLRSSGGRISRPHAGSLEILPPLKWPREWIECHRHHHHRFDRAPRAPGAEIESSRGCPFNCSFCLRDGFRNQYRRRPLPNVIAEMDHLIACGAEYLYFIDETFFPDFALLEALESRPVEFGIQTRIDLWSPAQLEMLGSAGCVSLEAGVESISDQGCRKLQKAIGLAQEEVNQRLACAKRHISFVQANLISIPEDEIEAIGRWREKMHSAGVWANDPVPLFPFPGTGEYRRRWGAPDDRSWERAHAYYLSHNKSFSDLQAELPLSLEELEKSGGNYAP